MKRITVLLIATLALASCGADGKPTRPTANASVGVDSSGNIRTGASVGTRIGPVGVSLGL